MRKVIVVAVRDYQAAVRTKGFIVSLIAIPVLMGGSIAVQALTKDRVDLVDRKVAVVDQTGVLFEGLRAAAEARNAGEIFEGEGDNRKQKQPKFLITKADVDGGTLAERTYVLSQKVRDGELFAFVVIKPEVLSPQMVNKIPSDSEGGSAKPIKYYSNNPTFEQLPRWLRSALNLQIRNVRLQQANIDPKLIAQLTVPAALANLGLVERDESGQITKAKETNELATFLLPFGLLMLMWMIVMFGAQPLVQGVLEEKMQRIAEVLLGSITPFELMLGKLLGIVGVSLTIATLYMVAAFVMLQRSGFGQYFPSELVVWFVVYQALAVLMFGSIFAAIGAAVSDLREAQSIMMPATVLVMLPLFFWVPVVREPGSTLSTVLSLIPTCTPMLMIVRQAVPPGVPTWQPVLGVVLVMVTTVLCVVLAGRIFRVGLLVQGKGAKLSDMVRWAIKG